MLTELNKSLEVIAKFNKNEFLEKTVDPHLFKEQKENLNALKDLLERYSETMKILKAKDRIEEADLVTLSDVHKMLQDITERIDQLDDLMILFIKSLFVSKVNSPLEEE